MGAKDPRIDTYIAKAGAFAQPVLNHLRALVHHAVPDAEETIKWGMPFFMYQGMLCHMAAFKAHCAFRIHHGDELSVGGKEEGTDGMGQFGKIIAISDLPSDDTLIGYLKEGAARNAAVPAKGNAAKSSATKESKPPKPPKASAATVPDDLAAALNANPAAAKAFEAFAPSHRREYITWIEDAKQPATREKRLQTTIEWVAEGKTRNWKYEKK